MWVYIAIGIIAAVIICGVIFTAKRNNEIKQNGIETDAVVSRINENESVDEDGFTTVSYTYYVTYRTMDGQTVEAKLGSGKSIDNNIIGKPWDSDLKEGVNIRIKYLPDKPKYVIRISDNQR